jgi:hypothetical protein
MTWVRIHPFLGTWPGGGGPPAFDISADENGTAAVELAWDPQALLAPASYPDPLRYYASDVPFNADVTADNGSARTIRLPAQRIELNGNRATWAIPADLWEGYVQETLKTLRTPPGSRFSRNLYYRVRFTPPGASSATVWPTDAVLDGPDAERAPHIGILPFSATPSSQVVPDTAAVAATGGIPLVAPSLWADVITSLWRNLPESDSARAALAAIFTHDSFLAADLQTRAALLKLWLFAGPTVRPRLPQLLDRQAVVGSGITMPILSKTALRGGRTLAQLLLDLLAITPHKDLLHVQAKEQLLDDVITEILDPNGQVNQGAAGTCSPTAIQTLLLTVNPAEYVRLQLGLLSDTGSAVLAGGATVTVPPAIFQAMRYVTPSGGALAPFLLRSNSELAFQAAILKYAQGSRFPALTGTPESIKRAFEATISGGLLNAETKRALDGLFGVTFTTNEVSFPYQPGQPGWQAGQRAVRDRLLADLPERQQQIVFAMFWGQPAGTPNGGAHAVLGVRHDGGRVFYKNPQYAGSSPPGWIVRGAPAANPPRRWDDPTQSLESIADGDLATWIFGYWTPATAII